jgi:uncharacterized protein YidB (DUF937 family)
MVVELRQKTGLSRSEILSRLAATLPQTVNRLTPHGPPDRTCLGQTA